MHNQRHIGINPRALKGRREIGTKAVNDLGLMKFLIRRVTAAYVQPLFFHSRCLFPQSIKCASAAPVVRDMEIIEVHPRIRRHFQPFHHRQRFMVGARVLGHQVVALHRRPQQRFSPLGGDFQVVEPRKRGFAPFFHVAQVQEKSEDARPARELHLRWAEIVVGAVVLPLGVFGSFECRIYNVEEDDSELEIWKCVQQRNSEFSKWSDTIDSTETVEMERQHQRRLVHY